MPHADPAERRAYHRAWARRNRDRYREREAALGRVRHANRRAEAYGAPGLITIEDVISVLSAGGCYGRLSWYSRTRGFAMREWRQTAWNIGGQMS